MPGDGIDPWHDGFGGTVGVARTVNPHPTVLQHILCIIANQSPAAEVSEKQRREPPAASVSSLINPANMVTVNGTAEADALAVSAACA